MHRSGPVETRIIALERGQELAAVFKCRRIAVQKLCHRSPGFLLSKPGLDQGSGEVDGEGVVLRSFFVIGSVSDDESGAIKFGIGRRNKDRDKKRQAVEVVVRATP